MGSDLSAHRFALRELGYMHRDGGMSVEETLLAATAGGAEMCGVADARGRIAPGFIFDAILLDQDPGDLTVFDDPAGVTGVFQGGRVIKPHERAAALAQRDGSLR
jgi:imidazolonepropionase-like amidohydrolase